MLTVSDWWWEFLCPFGRKEPDERKSRDRKIERFLIYTGRSYTPVDHVLSINLIWFCFALCNRLLPIQPF